VFRTTENERYGTLTAHARPAVHPNKMTSRVARSAGLIGVATMASRLLGVARETVLAATFGSSAPMDAFNVAFRVPNLLRDLFAEGAMTAAFVPTFTRTLTQKGEHEAWRLGSLVINALVLVTGILALLGILFADQITTALAPEFARIPGKLELTAALTRVMMPFFPMIAVAAAAMGILNARHRFFVPSLAPAMFNVATIICAVVLAPLMPRFGQQPIMAIAIGTLLGGLGQILLQWPLLRREGFRYQPVVSFRNDGVREVLRLMIPGVVGVAAVQVNVVVNTILASSEPPGSVSWLGYAFRVMYLPIGLFGVSIAMASLPDISRHAVSEDIASIRTTVSRGLRMMLVLNVPATLGLIALAEPIVSLLYERRHFSPADTVATAGALAFYAPGLIGYSAVKIASPTFYSLGDSRTPVTISVLSVAVNLVLNLALVRVLSFRGLALGTALAALFNAGALLWLLRGRLHGLDARPVLNATLKIGLASILMAVAARVFWQWLMVAFPMSGELARILRVFSSIAVGVLVLAAAAKILRVEEFDEAWRRLLGRILPRRTS
jgi:putative peptidoglycan lipid II flippase